MPARRLTARIVLTALLLAAAEVQAGPPAREQFWSLLPVQDHAPPPVKDSAWGQSAVDRFILHELEARGLHPVAPADRRTLLRRATYDLTGLPPTPEEIDAFLNDESPTAFAKVVDRLLASPAYGERWGRHWLDVVRYADTAGDNSDYPIPQMYRYRNWVIRAVAADLPYDQFVREQLAGDLMPANSPDEHFARVIATGYLANSKRFGSYEDARYPWHLTIEDTIDNFGRTFLGLTINCCRCHDHKFDPLSQEDYYALYGFFSSTRYPWPGIELDQGQHDLVPLADRQRVAAFEEETRSALKSIDARLKEIDTQKSAAEKSLGQAEKLADETKRKEQIADLTRRLGALKAEQKQAQDEKGKVGKRPLPFDTAYAVAEGKTEGKKKVGNACVQIKGDPEHPGKEVPRRFLTVLGGQVLPAGENGSGRLQLATWVTDPANPLFARVMVNRIWHFHFGVGIVPTPGDFGKQGRPPTHPQLLDYLARRFIESGWSLKAMHRMLMLSRTYQMASHDDESNARIDVANEYFWRFPRRRLDAESIRDTLLLVSGALDRVPGGPHPFPAAATWKYTQHNPFKAVYDSSKRSVYLMQQRIQRHPFLGLFDGADTNSSTARRITSTTPLQALYLMNDPFVHDLTRRFAARLLAERPDDPSRIERAYVLLFARPPTGSERAALSEYLDRVRGRLPASQRDVGAWESLTRALWMSNEFVYVD